MAHLVSRWSYYNRFESEKGVSCEKLREALTRAFRRAVSKSNAQRLLLVKGVP